MENYKLTQYGVVRLSDNAFIFGPNQNSPDWAAYVNWLTAGNTPLPQYSLSELKSLKIDSINRNCQATIVGGFTSLALGVAYVYDSDIEDQINLIGSMLASQTLLTIPFRCRLSTDTQKTWHNHTPAQIQQVYADGVTFKTTKLMQASTLKDQVNAATTEQQVQSIVWVP